MRSRSQRKLRSKNTPRPYDRLFVSAAAFASEAPHLSASFSHLMKLAGRPLSTGTRHSPMLISRRTQTMKRLRGDDTHHPRI